MRELRGKRVLVTGGAAGIGLAIAERFAAEGAELVLTDINAAALDAAAAVLRARGVTVRTYVLDVTDTPAILRVRDQLHAEAGPIDVLVNNAGVVFGGPFLGLPLEKHLVTFRVNTLGPVAMTHAFLPDLLARPEGHLVNIASASGFIGLPNGSTYAASKWAAIGFSESMRLELEALGHRHVKVTAVCPSYVGTGLFDGVKVPRATRMLTPQKVADATVRAVKAGRFFVLTPWLVKITPRLKGLLPHRLFYMTAGLFGATSGMASWKGHGPGKSAEPPRTTTGVH